MNKIGIVVAMQEEREAIEKVMEEVENQSISNLEIYIGKISGKKCIMVQSGVGKVNAARATQVLIDNYKVKTIVNIGAAGAVNAMLDIGDILIGKKAIQHDFDITAFGHSKGYITGVGNESGVGKVNAARATQVLIDNYKVKTIVNIGAAGAVNAMLDIGDILIGKKAIQHDFDITAFGHSKGYITGVGNGVECDCELVEKVMHTIENIENKEYKTKLGVIATGDIFCTEVSMKDKISAKFNADVIDMECGAVAQVAYLSEIPFIAIRSISDTPNGNNASDFDENLEKASRRCGEVLKEVLKNF